jgi:hypothetical protein
MKTYTEQEMVEFGQYLLSAEREKSLKANKTSVPYSQRKRQVYDADLTNFKTK